jgi:ABC-type polysaccharide/polyol phosphate export permease
VGLALPQANVATVALGVPLVLASFVDLGLLTAGTTMLVRRSNPVAVLLGSLSFFVAGVMYPVTVLPPWLQAVGRFLPLTHALVVLRGGFLTGARRPRTSAATWRRSPSSAPFSSRRARRPSAMHCGGRV